MQEASALAGDKVLQNRYLVAINKHTPRCYMLRWLVFYYGHRFTRS